MHLPEMIATEDDLRVVAAAMKKHNLKVPIKGFTFRNGERHEVTYAYARANDSGDNILLETRNRDRETRILESWAIYPQIVSYLRAQIKTA